MQILGVCLAVMAATTPAPADTVGYWQQEVHYRIEGRLDEASGVLAARERVTYVNHSPDTLEAFYVHLYLNAFRPGSRWADRDSIEGNRRFNDLRDPDYAFDRLGESRIDGVVVIPEYPYAPDSTIARFALPHRLRPGDTLEVDIAWRARPSTTPRRQGRQGRRFDFAQWYPRVVVYDREGWEDHPLYPAGEFYGEFGTYDVVLDLAADQVIGATGVPIEGDPGWTPARADPTRPVTFQRDYYGTPAWGGKGCAGMSPGPGRKCVRFYAEGVHHFAMSLNPDYVYEEGRFEDVVVRVLYQPQDRSTWGGGVAVRRTEEALRWLDTVFGDFAWPQITNVHRIEGGGTEFPMMVMNGGPGFGLILHEVGHNYLMGILANNEWKEGFLDEGFTSFQTSLYAEQQTGRDPHPRLSARVLPLDVEGWSQPLSTPGEKFRDFATYNMMTYVKGQLFYFQLRYVIGPDAMRRVLREYYARWKLKHVTARDFQEVAEEVSGQNLDWLFRQWLHETVLIDYAMGSVRRRQQQGGSWETTVTVRRLGDGWMPVEIGELRPDGTPTVYTRVFVTTREGEARFVTRSRPGPLVLDPRQVSHDWNRRNNREGGFLGGARWRLDTYLSEPSEPDRTVISIAPAVWSNDASDLTVGLRVRTNDAGRYNRWTIWFNRGLSDVSGIGGFETATLGDAFDFRVRLENPFFLRHPRTTQVFEGWAQEGTVGSRVTWAVDSRRSFRTERGHRTGVLAQWVATRETPFLDDTRWANAGTVEAGVFREWNRPTPTSAVRFRVEGRVGVAYRRDRDLLSSATYDTQTFGRWTASGTLRRPIGGFRLGVRAFGGLYVGGTPIPQRAIPVNGADPYEMLENPFVRTRGALAVGSDVFYHSPGNLNLRGYAPTLGGRWGVGLNLEVERDLVRRPKGVLRRASLVGFWDAALVDTLAVASSSGNAFKGLTDGGPGLRVWFHLGDVTFPLRVEFPLYVSSPFVAHNRKQGNAFWEFRWLVSLQPIF